MEKIRIESRQNVLLNGNNATLFQVFEKGRNGYVFSGKYACVGKHSATEEECCIAYAATQDCLSSGEEA